MAASPLTEAARRENAMTLASLLGVASGEAATLLDACVVVTSRSNDAVACHLASHIRDLLERTVSSVTLESDHDATVEITIGEARPRTGALHLAVAVLPDAIIIRRTGVAASACAHIPAVLLRLSACYAAAAAMQLVLGPRAFLTTPNPFILSFAELGIDIDRLGDVIQLETAYLAGAGAIGNGLLWAAEDLDLRGCLTIADDDLVSNGNLNRQILFSAADVGLPKATCLAAKASALIPKVEFRPRPIRLQQLEERTEGPWLRRLIVAVDSRRARRALQREMPREVFDASTTDVREVVVHYNQQLTTTACMSCIYMPDEAEYTREHHIAEQLGVTVDEVLTERISAESAIRIATRFPRLSAESIIGLAYDTLFKQLCSEAVLTTPEGRRVLAPFAFVSCLAGTLLLLEIVRRVGRGDGVHNDNYWRVSAWHPPLARRRVVRPREDACEFCGNPVLSRVNASLWG